MTPYRVELPTASLLTGTLARTDFADAYAIDAAPGATLDQYRAAIAGSAPAWVDAAMRLRNRLARLARLDVVAGDGFLPELASTATEILYGTDDRHLDFRAVLRLDDGRLVLATVVQLHNRLGRAYFAVVRRVHPFVVRAVLRRLGARVTAPR